MDYKDDTTTAFQLTRGSEGLVVSLPVKGDRFRTLLNLVWVLVWIAGEVSIVGYIRGGFGPLGGVSPVPLPLSSLFLALFTAAGGLVLWRSMWGMGGRETFVLAGAGLSARREIWGIGRTRIFENEDIRSVRATRLKYRVIYPSWGRMFIGHDDSEIVIDCAGHLYAYGKGLEKDEAKELVDVLLKEMQFQSRKEPLPKEQSSY